MQLPSEGQWSQSMFCSWRLFSGFCFFVKALKEQKQIPEELYDQDRSLQGNYQNSAVAARTCKPN
jgi:hypothetical protein